MKEITTKRTVSHPDYYQSGEGWELADVIDAFELNFSRGCAVKYICRAGRKDPEKELEDLMKAKWYLDREIRKMEEEA